MTVPRLELSAAFLLTRLMTSIRTTLGFATVPCFCWTDSTIVLAWIRSHPSRWNIYVANRVNKVQTELPDAVWRHVPTTSNPADCASRGLYGDEILTHLWWQRPSWLQLSQEEWLEESLQVHTETPGEEKIHTSCRQRLPVGGSRHALFVLAKINSSHGLYD